MRMRLYIAVASSLSILILSGCVPTRDDLPEIEEKAYQRGQRLLREGRQQDALEAFLAVIAKRPMAAESHLEVGQLYLNVFNDPVMAIYHFRQYLAENPNSSQAPMVRQLIETGKKAFARGLPGAPFSEDIDRLDLLEALESQRLQMEALRQENISLKEQLSSVSSIAQLNKTPLTAFPLSSSDKDLSGISAQASTILATSKTYVVQPGDTLSKISTRVYNTPIRWKAIYEANRDQLRSPHDLKLGQTLRIP